MGTIEAVDVVALDPRAVNLSRRVSSDSRHAEVKLTGADAQRIAELWRALPPGDSARCHMPPYGLRFWAGGKIAVEATLCWQCNNVYGHAGDEGFGFGFDARSIAGVALLMQCQHVLPNKPA